MSVEQQGPHEVGACPRGVPSTLVTASWLFDGGSKFPGSYLMSKSRSRRFHSVWTPFDISFLRNTEIGKKTIILGWASD